MIMCFSVILSELVDLMCKVEELYKVLYFQARETASRLL
jgi:hypothetical protein